MFNNLEISLKIAGRNPSATLINSVSKLKSVELISNPSSEKMSSLIENAQINILPSMNSTGVKLKIINALFRGRFCLVNTNAIKEDETSNLCNIANTPAEMIAEIKKLINQPFTAELIEERRIVLNKLYNNSKNAEKLISLLFPNYQ